jgi:hypothetical protein
MAMRHEWQVAATVIDSPKTEAQTTVPVAVCVRCGAVRTQLVAPGTRGQIDLSGDCAAPEAPASQR